MFKKFLLEETGATAIEYVLIAAMMGALIWGGLPVVEAAITGAINNVNADLGMFN